MIHCLSLTSSDVKHSVVNGMVIIIRYAMTVWEKHPLQSVASMDARMYNVHCINIRLISVEDAIVIIVVIISTIDMRFVVLFVYLLKIRIGF
jgi:hypothetical protein